MLPRGKKKTGQVVNCATCNKEIYRRPSQIHEFNYCSRECLMASGRARKPSNKVTKICEYCGNEYVKGPYAARTSKYCSKKCTDKANIIKQTVFCFNCGKSMERPPCTIKEKNYCSKSCASKHINKEKITRVKMKCEICNSEYEIKLSHSHKSKTCSRKCLAVYNQKKQGGHKRTSIEIKLDNKLKSLNFNYEEQYVVNSKFIADFYLPYYNIIIEAFGDYWHVNPEEYNENDTLTKPQIAQLKKDKIKLKYLTKCGYNVFILWEKGINADIDKAMLPVLEFINKIDNQFKNTQ